MGILRSSILLNVFEHAPCIVLVFLIACNPVEYEHRLNCLGPSAAMSVNSENDRFLEIAYLNI